MVKVALRQFAVEAHQVRDAAPGLKAHKGAAGFVGGPDAVCFGLVTAHFEVRLLVLVQEHYALHRAVFQHKGVDGEGLSGDGKKAVFIHRHGHGSVQFGEISAVQAVA